MSHPRRERCSLDSQECHCRVCDPLGHVDAIDGTLITHKHVEECEPVYDTGLEERREYYLACGIKERFWRPDFEASRKAKEFNLVDTTATLPLDNNQNSQ